MATRKKRGSEFDFKPFSVKQRKVLSWYLKDSPYHDYDMIIADGSIRSGKTVAMIIGFITWSSSTFNHENFIIAGKSMGALKRNVLDPLFKILNALGIEYGYVRSENQHITIGTNYYYLFGANNESSQDYLQGLTAAGAYADEAALLPQSFINQMVGRCSVQGSKVWLNCNPAGVFHFLKTDYIDRAYEKRILRLHFTLDDNLTLPDNIKERYRRMFTGVFYKRYILGQWVAAEGVIYDSFDTETMVVTEIPDIRKYYVGVDYGTSNATTFILCGLGIDDRLYIIDEYYHSGAETGRQKSPAEYSRDFIAWLSDKGGRVRPEYIFVDPSAEGFIITLWNDGVRGVVQADNEVKLGIELLSSIIADDRFRVHRRCSHVLKEITSYVWDTKAQARGEDRPLKTNDHTLDPIRYVANGTRIVWDRILRGGR
jgi:PBSX family phage terminase large subunit